MKIRPANKKDLKAVEKLYKIPEFKLPTGEYMKKEYLVPYLNKKQFLVAEEDKKIVGAITGIRVKGKGSMIYFIAIHKKMRGKGIGTELLKQYEKNCKKQGVEWIMLYASPTKATLGFYKKHKYHIGNKCIEAGKVLY
jgi:N-acetylglutamate synthase-like GNAT family acetyltransferase